MIIKKGGYHGGHGYGHGGGYGGGYGHGGGYGGGYGHGGYGGGHGMMPFLNYYSIFNCFIQFLGKVIVEKKIYKGGYGYGK